MSDMIEKCNFKSVHEVPICIISQLAINWGDFRIVHTELKILNAKCLGEENCILYQIYKNSVLIRRELIDGHSP